MMKEYSIRELQLKTLECLKEVKRICEKNQIPYFLSWGSALGAVRHQGFIPWDDDIDICMMYADYLRFLEACKMDLDTKRFFLQTPDTDYHTLLPYAKLRMNHTTSMDAQYSHVKMHWGVCIDIFPLRNAPDSPKKRKQLLFYSKLYRLVLRRSVISGTKRMVLKILCLLFTEKGLRKKLQKRIDSLCPTTETGTIFDTEGISAGKVFYPSKLVEGIAMLPFEGIQFSCPEHADEYLTYMYGDYMTPPPESNRTGHTGIIVDLEKDYSEYQK